MPDDTTGGYRPPLPPRSGADRRHFGYKIRADLDEALRAYVAAERTTLTWAVDTALESFLYSTGWWSPDKPDRDQHS